MRTTILILSIFFFLASAFTQTDPDSKSENEKRRAAAKEIMTEAWICAMITQDSTGLMNVRTMQPFSPEEDLTVWFGTNALSRKVQDIKANDNIVLYYTSTDASGYVVLHGKADLIDDDGLKQKYWMESWADFYPDRSLFLLIKFVPESIEILSNKHQITSDSPSWRVPAINLK